MPTLAFFKPYGVLSRFTDPEGRPTLADYISLPDVYPAGRLDKDSEGLLLLTDDGRLASRITHPRYHLEKVYLAQVERIPDEAALERLRRGVVIRGRRTRPALVELLEKAPDLPPRPVPIRYRKNVPTAWLKITLREGRNRQVRRMTAAVGHPTLRLVRVAIGPVELGDLSPGEWRKLSPRELRALQRG
ncbi:MAG TPA: pseudouridine synthase [Chloroflexi bacterium]|nr:pseudouridine synthase [Chloroflexota bacterium]